MRVFILEDVIEHQVRLENVIREIEQELQLEIDVTSSGKVWELEDFIKTGAVNQIYFLDIEIKDQEKKGLEIAQEIRKKDPYAIIVFITSRSEFALTTYQYKVSALDFINKELNDTIFKKKIKESIVYAQEHLVENKDMIDYFEYQYKNSPAVVVPYRDILYIETTGNQQKLRLVCKNLQKEFVGILSDLLEKEEARKKKMLYKVHKSVVVNINNVQEIDRRKREVSLFGGEAVPLSRTLMTAFRQEFEKISPIK